MFVTQDLPIGIVVDRDELGTPADRHRETAGQDQRDAQLQADRPRFARTERRVGPIVSKGEGPHFVRAGRAIRGLESKAAEPSWRDAIHSTPRNSKTQRNAQEAVLFHAYTPMRKGRDSSIHCWRTLIRAEGAPSGA